MAGKKIGVVLALDGEKQFVQGVANAKKESALLQSELKKLSAEYEGNANSLDFLQKKQENLGKQTESYTKRLEESKKGLENAQNVQKENSSFMPVDFSSFLDRAGDLKPELRKLLSDHLDELSSVQSSILAACRELPSMRVISDGDMDPKNVMWQGTTPFVIDLECLDYANPMRSVLELGIQWAGAVTYDFSKEKLLAFFKGYLEKYDNGYRSYEDLYGFVYQNWIEWLEYNLGRAAGKEVSSEEEKQLGESESENTLKLIHYLSEIEPQVREMLTNDLPPVCAQNFDTHDQRLCYFEIMFEGSLEHIPDYPLPEGYRVRAVTVDEAPEKVKQDWIEIEKSAREFETYEQGEEAWNRYYGSRTEMLPGRMFFVEDATGQRVATATAFFDIYGRDQSGAGWLHWVAVRREEQGKGLSKPLIAAVLKRLKELGHSQVKIPTQTTTWLACKVYYDMGFRPIPKNLVSSRAGWKMLEQLAGIRVF